VRIAMIEMGCNLALNLALVFGTDLGFVGLSISGALCAWINLALLYGVLRRRDLFHTDPQLRRRLPRLLLAALAMGGVLLLLRPWIEPHLDGGILVRAAGIAALILPGVITYFACAFLFGAFDWRETKALLSRRRRA
jgi:putative peptidoglycan lipid II flippase